MREMPESWQRHEVVQKMRKMSRRLLRTFRRWAWDFHHCDSCAEPICPGDEYMGEVYVVTNPTWAPHRRTVISVWKFHDICPIDPWERDREMLRDSDRDTPASDVANVA